jgi:hypothetical protein
MYVYVLHVKSLNNQSVHLTGIYDKEDKALKEANSIQGYGYITVVSKEKVR